jgi:hypothetical protein
MNQVPDVFVGFHSSERGHAAQADSVLYDPKKFSVGILLHAGGSQVGCSGIHPSPRVSWFPSRITVALGTFGTEELVSFGETRLPIRGRRRSFSPAGSSNEQPLALGREERLDSTWLGKGAEIELKSYYAADEQQERENRGQDENRSLHWRTPRVRLEM